MISIKWYYMLLIVLATCIATYFVNYIFCGIYTLFAFISIIYWLSKYNIAKEEFNKHLDTSRTLLNTSDIPDVNSITEKHKHI